MVLVQLTKGEHPPFNVAHSFTSVQAKAPLLVYPDGQLVHIYEPMVLLQARKGLQPPFAVAHSFTSEQLNPLPTYPDGQALQLKLPIVFVHTTNVEHPPLVVAHSFTSLHDVIPEPENPAGQLPQV